MDRLPINGTTLRNIIDRINGLIDGRSNASGDVTLTAGATSTLVESPIFNANARVLLTPKTANAAAAAATTYANMTAGGGSFTVTHANAVSTDRTFAYLVIGG